MFETRREKIEEWYDKEYERLEKLLEAGVITEDQYKEEIKFLRENEREELDDLNSPF